MDELRGVGRWATDKLALAKERERLRVEDRLRQLDELDEAIRELIRLRGQQPGYTWDQEAEKLRLRALGLGPTIGDEELEQLIAAIAGDPDAGDDAYLPLARRLAALRQRTFAPEGD